MKVAIFGAGGYIGRHLINELRLLEDELVLYSSSTQNIFNAETGVLNPSVHIPQETDCVVYLAQSPHHRHMPEMAAHLWGVNVVSAMKVAEKARACGAKKFIYASTGNAYAPGFHPHPEEAPLRRNDWYALSKVHAEESLALYRKDMSVTIARIFGVYGPGQTDRLVPNLVRSVRSSSPIKLAPHPFDSRDDDGLKLSLCYIDDVVRIFSCLIHDPAPPDVINVAGSEALSIRDIAREIGERLGIAPDFNTVSQPREFDLLADVTRLVNLQNPTFTPFKEGIIRVLQC